MSLEQGYHIEIVYRSRFFQQIVCFCTQGLAAS